MVGVFAAGLLLNVIVAPSRAAAFVTFETGQVRPLALSPDGRTLLALNTPDARLEVFAVDGGDVSPVGSVPVGLEPVAVAARTNTEVWVVNHLSDSVSIVDIGATPPRVVRTLLVGDEPRDIVFAGPTDAGGHFTRAFITTARLGQNLPDSVPPNLTTPGTPRALVYVFDAANLGDRARRHPGDDHRALRRHAARPRRVARRPHRVRRRLSVGQPDRRPSPKAPCATAAPRAARATSTACRCPAACRRPGAGRAAGAEREHRGHCRARKSA